MERYKVICEVSRKQAYGEDMPDRDKEEIVSLLLKDVEPDRTLGELKIRPHTDKCPYFYLPPYCCGKRLRLVQGYQPKTNILYNNHYELEILRLLAMYAPSEPRAQIMTEAALYRLRNTCFGISCTQGECFPTGISVLRFLSALPEKDEWIDKLLHPLGEAFMSFGNGGAAVQKGLPLTYLLMALTDIRNDTAIALINKKKDWLLDLLRRGRITDKRSDGRTTEADKYNLMGKYIIRNALGILPEYKDIREHKIYVDPSDGRCYCDI